LLKTNFDILKCNVRPFSFNFRCEVCHQRNVVKINIKR
jgi:hypothetical protein